MSLENARDSYVDLLMIKAEQQAQKQRLRDKLTKGAASSRSVKPIKTQTSFRVKNNVGCVENFKNETTAQSPSLEVAYYEPCEVEEDDEDSWPIWEMTNDDQKKYNFILGRDYPLPIVNLSETRKRALSAFKTISE